MSIQERKQWRQISEFPGGAIDQKEKFVPFHRTVYRVRDNFGGKRYVSSIKEAEALANSQSMSMFGRLPKGSQMMERSQ